MFDTIAPRYDLVNRIMTFRMDVGWRRRAISALGLAPGSAVADLACGTGDFCYELERRGLRPIGFDLSFGMLAAAPRPFARAQADALLEVAEPPNPLLRAGHQVYFGRVVPIVGGLISDRDAYSYLPRSVAYLPPVDEMLASLAGTGFEHVSRRLLSVGITQLITATRSA